MDCQDDLVKKQRQNRFLLIFKVLADIRVLDHSFLFITDQQFYSKLLEEIVIKQFCSPREDPKTEMAAISEETFSQTVSYSPMI